MEIGQFVKVVKELSEKIQVSNLIGNFTTLIQNLTKLQQQAQTAPQNRQQTLIAVENSKREIKTAINTFIPTSLSVEETKIYELLNAYNLFGYEGQLRFENAFAQLQTNPTNVLQQIQQYNKDVTVLNQLYSSLVPFNDKLAAVSPQLDSKDLIILFFQAGAEINNLDEMEKASSKWNQVLISFALLARETNRTFRIETVERGSIILTLSAITGVVLAFGTATDKVLDAIKKYYEIKKLAHSAKLLPGVPEKTIEDLENSSKLKIDAETNDITKQLLEKYAWEADSEENKDKSEVDNAVSFAVKYLLKFINKGGKVDIKLVASSSPEEKKVQVDLTIKYNEIKEIENKISVPDNQKQILDVTDDNTSNDDKI